MSVIRLLTKALAWSALAITCSVSLAQANEKFTIGIVFPFMNIAWEQRWLDSAKWAADQLKNEGYEIEIKALDGAGDAQTQIQHVNNLTLQGVDYIIVHPLSETALNGAIDNAIDAGIPVMATSIGSVTNPRPVQLVFDNAKYIRDIVDYLAERTGGKANALNIRGVAGTAADTEFQTTLASYLQSKYPDIKIVGDVYGEWNQSTAQQRVAAIIPTLPKVDIAFSTGVAAFGIGQAFLTAGQEVPLQVYGLDGVDLKLLISLNEKGGYISKAMNNDPGTGSVAINVAVAELTGVKVPRKLVAPTLWLDFDEVKKDYSDISDADSAYRNYGYDWTLNNVINSGK